MDRLDVDKVVEAFLNLFVDEVHEFCQQLVERGVYINISISQFDTKDYEAIPVVKMPPCLYAENHAMYFNSGYTFCRHCGQKLESDALGTMP